QDGRLHPVAVRRAQVARRRGARAPVVLVAVRRLGPVGADERGPRQADVRHQTALGPRVAISSWFAVVSGAVKTALRSTAKSSIGAGPLPARFVFAAMSVSVSLESPSRYEPATNPRSELVGESWRQPSSSNSSAAAKRPNRSLWVPPLARTSLRFHEP